MDSIEPQKTCLVFEVGVQLVLPRTTEAFALGSENVFQNI